MKKKCFVTFALALVLLSSSMLLFACGNSVKNPYTEIQTLVTQMRTDTEIFTSNYTYALKDLAAKNESGALEDVGEVEKAFCQIPLKFIEKHYNKLENTKGEFDDIAKSLNKLTKSYKKIKEQHEEFASVASDVDYVIYNGNYYNYSLVAQEFATCALNLAIELGDFLIDNQKIEEKDFLSLTNEQYSLIYEYEYIKIVNDAEKVLYDSCNKQDLTNALANNAKSALVNARVQYNNIEKLTVLTEEMWNDFKEMSKVFNNQRNIFEKAIKGISVYELVTNYDNSLEAYSKNDSERELDWKQAWEFIRDYTSKYLAYLVTFMAAN